MVEKVNANVRRAGADYKINVSWSSETMLLAKIYLEHFVSELLARALKDETTPLHQSLLSFFLCWNRYTCTGVAPTLNLSLLVKWFFRVLSVVVNQTRPVQLN